jgi:hypothetical protein
VSPRITRGVHATGEALRHLADGALLTGGFLALLWLAELATLR